MKEKTVGSAVASGPPVVQKPSPPPVVVKEVNHPPARERERERERERDTSRDRHNAPSAENKRAPGKLSSYDNQDNKYDFYGITYYLINEETEKKKKQILLIIFFYIFIFFCFLCN